MSAVAFDDPKRFAVIGAGAWGTALAILLAKAGNTVHLLSQSKEKAELLQASRVNSHALPSIRFPATLSAHSLEQYTALRDSDPQNAAGIVVLAMPAQDTRSAVDRLAGYLTASDEVIVTAKGIERGTQKLLTDVIAEQAPRLRPCILSGPSFAHDVAGGLPTAVTLAAETLDQADRVSQALRTPSFRPYASDDLIGVQLGGALKNVLAIAAGIVEGQGLGESAKAALITRGFAELSRLSIKLGARPETLSGLSGLGDLILTCSTAGSRNFRFGTNLGKGRAMSELLADGQPLAEGVKTAQAALALGQEHRIDMPITQTVAAIVEENLPVADAIEALMARPLRRE